MASTKLQGDVYVTLPEGLGGGGGASTYDELPDKPKINDTELSGDMSAADLGLMPVVEDATEGNIAVLDSDGNVAELPAGTEGQVLTQGANGAEWADPTGGGEDGHSPYIGTNGHWFEWDDTEDDYVDTNVSAQGPQGPQGETGETGPQGPQGPQGPSVDISGKMDKVTAATEGNIPVFDSDGGVTDSNKKPSDFASAEDVGDLDELETTDKTNIVGAINEVKGGIPALDDNVTSSSANGVKSSGIYAAVNSAIDSDTSTTAVSEALVVGKTYKYMPSAGVATLTFTLTPPTESDVVRFWRFKFKSGATATEFVPPSNLYWVDGKAFIPEANTIYEVMIDEDYCVSVLAFKQVSNG